MELVLLRDAHAAQAGDDTAIWETSTPVTAEGLTALIALCAGEGVAVGAGALTGTDLAANVVTSSLTTIGSMVGGSVPPPLIPAGTFPVGAYVFQGAISGITTLLTTGAVGIGGAALSATRLTVYTGATGNAGIIVRAFAAQAANMLTAQDSAGVRMWSVSQVGIMDSILASVGSQAWRSSITGDANFRYIIFGDGKLEWGAGAGARDTNLYRSAADILRTDDALIVGTTLQVGSAAIAAGARIEANLATGSATITPVGILVRTQTSAADWVFGATNYWGFFGFRADDTSGPGASTRARLTAHFEDAGGVATGVALWVSPTGGLAIAQTWNSDLSTVLAGKLTLVAGTTTVSPLVFQSGPVLTVSLAGRVEFLTDDLFFTITTGAARKGVVLDDGARLTSGRIPAATTNGRLVDGPVPAADATYANPTSITIVKGLITAIS